MSRPRVHETKTSALMPVIAHRITYDRIIDAQTLITYLPPRMPARFATAELTRQRIVPWKRITSMSKIEYFWNQARRVLRKGKGIDKYFLFLKRCMFRFNHGSPSQEFNLLKLCRKI